MKCGSRKKVKKFAAGGETKEYPAFTSVSSLDEKGELKKPEVTAPKQSFGEAFKAARGSGKSEFTWNGKSYNTKLKEEVAKPRPSIKLEEVSVSAKRLPAESPLPKIPTPKLDASRYTANGPTNQTRYVPGAEKAIAEQRERSRKAVRGYAKGGKVRGDGCASKGKTKGRMC